MARLGQLYCLSWPSTPWADASISLGHLLDGSVNGSSYPGPAKGMKGHQSTGNLFAFRGTGQLGEVRDEVLAFPFHDAVAWSLLHDGSPQRYPCLVARVASTSLLGVGTTGPEQGFGIWWPLALLWSICPIPTMIQPSAGRTQLLHQGQCCSGRETRCCVRRPLVAPVLMKDGIGPLEYLKREIRNHVAIEASCWWLTRLQNAFHPKMCTL